VLFAVGKFLCVSGAKTEAMADDMSDSEWKTFTRVESQYTNESERFVLPHRNFQRQYAHIYAARLWALRPKLQSAVTRQYGSSVPVCRYLTSMLNISNVLLQRHIHFCSVFKNFAV